MNSTSTGRIATVAGLIAAVSAAGYVVYFDYQRRNNASFRRQLKRQSKKHAKLESMAQEEAKQARLKEVGEALTNDLVADPIPTDPAKREAAFASYVELGERLSMTPGKEIQAACKFYKALSVYPNPADLLSIYQRTIPEALYEIVVMMIAVLPPANIASFLGTAGNTAAARAAAEAEISAMVQEND